LKFFFIFLHSSISPAKLHNYSSDILSNFDSAHGRINGNAAYKTQNQKPEFFLLFPSPKFREKSIHIFRILDDSQSGRQNDKIETSYNVLLRGCEHRQWYSTSSLWVYATRVHKNTHNSATNSYIASDATTDYNTVSNFPSESNSCPFFTNVALQKRHFSYLKSIVLVYRCFISYSITYLASI